MAQRDPRQRPYEVAEEAQRYLQERTQARTARERDLLARLQKVQRELDRWDEWDALKAEERIHRPSRRPSLSRTTLIEMRQMLVEELDRLQRTP